MPKLCEYMDKDGNRCETQASFGYNEVSFCSKHKDDDMKNVLKSKRKGYCKCGKRASFGFKGERATCCKQCKLNGMINVKNRKCVVCKISQPNFGIEGKPASHCGKCKLDGMINVKSRKCMVCKAVRPNFGIEGKPASHCGKCKLDGMINVESRKCIVCKITRATFGIEGKSVSHCGKCKLDEMISINNKKCVVCGIVSPCFGIQGELASHCGKCKLDGMINVKSRMCVICRSSQAIFGIEGESPNHCGKCKLDGMINVKSQKCVVCKIAQPSFGMEGTSVSHCGKCKLNGMINFRIKKCKSNTIGIMCPVQANRYYDGYCTRCFGHLFPAHPKTAGIRTKSKELQVVSHISQHYEGFIHDKPLYVDLEGGCCTSKRRIDLRKLVDGTILAIEIDEEQRKYHLDTQRYDDLFMDFSGKYVFIRYNPDKYRNKKGENKNPKFQTRMKCLQTEIDKQIERIQKGENTELVEIVYLYYHGDKDD